MTCEQARIAIERTTDRLVADFARAYHGGGARPADWTAPDWTTPDWTTPDWTTPGDFVAAVAAVRKLSRDGAGARLGDASRRALDRSEAAILHLVANWPSPLADAAAAWELILAARPERAD